MTVAELSREPEMSRLAEDDALNASKDTFVGGTGPAGIGADRDEESSLPRQKSKGGVMGAAERCMDLLVEYGVEERGIQPVPIEASHDFMIDGLWLMLNRSESR